MKIIIALLFSMVAVHAANYFVVESDNTISNLIVADANFNPGTGKTKAPVSSLPKGAKIGDKWNGSALTSVSPVVTLAEALRTSFAELPDDQRLQLYSAKATIESASQSGEAPIFIKSLILGMDFSDDPDLKAAQDRMLALPQWNQNP